VHGVHLERKRRSICEHSGTYGPNILLLSNLRIALPPTPSQAVHGVYLERKRRSIDRLLGNYIKPDGQAVGVPPDLREVSPHAQQLVHLVAGIQSETFTYARCVQ
jgi:hypothetical protein